MILILLYILSITILFYLKRSSNKEYIILNYSNSYNWTSGILIVLIAIGFFLNLDYSDRWGCIVTEQPTFRASNVLFSAIALILTLGAVFINKKKIKVLIHSCELIVWIGKLIVFKGGYVVGFTASPDVQIVLYDFIALFIRFLVIRNIGYGIRTIYLYNISVVIILIKIYVFPTQQTINWEHEKSLENSLYTLNQLQGHWSGLKITYDFIIDTVINKIDSSEAESHLIYMLSKDTLLEKKEIFQYDTVYMTIDSCDVSLYNADKEASYLLGFVSESSATMYQILPDSIEGDTALMKFLDTKSKVRSDWMNNSEIFIRRLESDSLIFEEGFIKCENEFKLGRKTTANK